MIYSSTNDHVIGCDSVSVYNKMDRVHFKNVTQYTPCSGKNLLIVGRKTWESLPKSMVECPFRDYLILTRNLCYKTSGIIKHNFNDVLEHCSLHYGEYYKIFIIGGVEIFKLMMGTIFVTQIYHTRYCINLGNNDLFSCFDANYDQYNLVNETVKKGEISLGKNDPKEVDIIFRNYERKTKPFEIQYLKLLHSIVNEGVTKETRNAKTISLTDQTIKIDLSEGFPILTLRKSFWKGIKEELLWMISGSTDVDILKNKNIHIWDGNSSREYLDKCGLSNLNEGDIGPGYGFQMRFAGAKYVNNKTNYQGQGVDQLNKCIELIKKNPTSRRIILNLWNVSQLDQMSLPPCFLENTLILTKKGYIKIQEVEDNDRLLTHLGNFCKINQIHVNQYTGQIISLKIENNIEIIKTTPDHPFYIKKNRDAKPEWIDASKLEIGYRVGYPIDNKAEINFDTQIDLNVAKYWYFIGYYLRYGWVKNDNSVGLVMHKDNINTIVGKISDVVEIFEDKNNIYPNHSIYYFKDIKWSNMLKEFGASYDKKIIPEWVQSLPEILLLKFVDGYFSADRSKRIRTAEISIYSLALQMQRIVNKINKQLDIDIHKSRMKYVMKLTEDKPDKSHNMVWFKIETLESCDVKDAKIYNFDVENDHSYIIQNISVHNCHYNYQFTVENGKLSCHLYQRSWDVMLGWNTTTAALLTHIIAHFCDLEPGYIAHTVCDAHIYQTHLESYHQMKNRIPYTLPKLIITGNKPETIDGYLSEQFNLIDYYYHPAIKMDMVP